MPSIPGSRLLTLCWPACLALAAGCAELPPSNPADATEEKTTMSNEARQEKPDPASGFATVTFGGGCFWCVEAVFQEVEGVVSVESGYSGGHLENPTYEQVCSGTTGHAEVCQITYDPRKVDFEQLLEIFWKTHDPTTLNRQGNDVGTQYRSVIFYHDDRQRELAERYKRRLDESGAWSDPIVTEISPLENFYAAERYHQDYFKLNPGQGYCQFVIRPKMDKFRRAFQDQLKEDAKR